MLLLNRQDYVIAVESYYVKEIHIPHNSGRSRDVWTLYN